MGESATTVTNEQNSRETQQILDALQALGGDIKEVKSDLQALTLEVKVNQAKTDEKLNSLQLQVDERLNSVQLQMRELKDDIAELRSQQKAIDARLWGFIVGLVTLLSGGLIKLAWFNQS